MKLIQQLKNTFDCFCEGPEGQETGHIELQKELRGIHIRTPEETEEVMKMDIMDEASLEFEEKMNNASKKFESMVFGEDEVEEVEEPEEDID